MNSQEKLAYCTNWLMSDEIMGVMDGHRSFHVCPGISKGYHEKNAWFFNGIEGRWFNPDLKSGVEPADLVDAFCQCLYKNDYNYQVRRDSDGTGWLVYITGGPGVYAEGFR